MQAIQTNDSMHMKHQSTVDYVLYGPLKTNNLQNDLIILYI